MKTRLFIILSLTMAVAMTAAHCLTSGGGRAVSLPADTTMTDTTIAAAPTAPAAKPEVMMPEALLYDVDSMLDEYYAKQYLTAMECDTSDTSPWLTDSEYVDRLQRMPCKMEMVYNDIVRSVIDKYTGRLRRTVSFMLGAANFYFPIFEEVLEKEGLPLELKYLPVIESALRPSATSHAGAAGLWQFMVATGRQYGLKVNTLVDERRDPFKSTHAAVHYLKDMYKIYGDWNLVIAAYNCGPGNVNKAIRRANGSHDYWVIYPYLPAETRGYVPAFIGANYAMNYYCEHKICPMRTELPMQCDTIMTTHNISLRQIADFCGMDIKQVRALNPQYRQDIIPGETEPSSICLPLKEMTILIDNEDSIYKYKADEYLSRRRVVKPRKR